MNKRKILWIALILASACKLFAATDPNAWGELNLGSTQLAGVTVYYEKCFEPNLPFFEKAYKEFLAERDKNKAILTKKEQIIADINHILGITEPDTEMQDEMMGTFLGVFSGAKPTFYLVRQTSIKDFLRAGGGLPNFTYDKATDMVSYQPKFGGTNKTEYLKDFDFTIPIASEESFGKEVNTVLQVLAEVFGYGKLSVSVAFHEVVEMSLLLRAKPKDPYWRWFSDGFANAITIELLKRHLSKEGADDFAADLDVSEYKDLEKEINLLYWMSAKFCIFATDTPLEYENKLIFARYNYATFEAQRLIDKYGINCIRQILDEICMKKSRTSHDLMLAIKEVTGEDMEARLLRYQTFKTRQEGMPKYTILFNAASKEKDYEQMLINLLRVMELHEYQFSPNNLQSWKNAAWLLFKMGHEKAGDEVMHNCIKLFEDSHIPEGRETAMERFIQYALECDKPQKALKVAEELLKTKPDNVLALTTEMLAGVQSGKFPEAKQTAKRILILVDEKSEPYKVASRVLAIDPNQSPPSN